MKIFSSIKTLQKQKICTEFIQDFIQFPKKNTRTLENSEKYSRNTEIFENGKKYQEAQKHSEAFNGSLLIFSKCKEFNIMYGIFFISFWGMKKKTLFLQQFCQTTRKLQKDKSIIDTFTMFNGSHSVWVRIFCILKNFTWNAWNSWIFCLCMQLESPWGKLWAWTKAKKLLGKYWLWVAFMSFWL